MGWIEFKDDQFHLDLPHHSVDVPILELKSLFLPKGKNYWVLILNFFSSVKFPAPENEALVIEELKKDFQNKNQEKKLQTGVLKKFFYLAP